MVTTCVASGCSNFQLRGNNIHFHNFPHNRPDILEKWVQAVGKVNWKPTKHSKLCSEHFKKEDYQFRPGANGVLLKQNAVPSVFNLPKNWTKEEERFSTLENNSWPESKYEDRTKEEDRVSIVENNFWPESKYEDQTKDEDRFSTLEKNFWPESKYEALQNEAMEIDVSENISLQQTCEQSTQCRLKTPNCPVKKILRRKIKSLNQKLRRRKQKIATMKDLIKTLKNNVKGTDELTTVPKIY